MCVVLYGVRCTLYARCAIRLDSEQLIVDFKLLSVFKCLVGHACVLKIPKTTALDVLSRCEDDRRPPLSNTFLTRCFTKMCIASFVRWREGHVHGAFKEWERHHIRPAGMFGTLAGYIFYWPWNPIHAGFMRFQVGLYNRSLLRTFWGITVLALFAVAAYRSLAAPS